MNSLWMWPEDGELMITYIYLNAYDNEEKYVYMFSDFIIDDQSIPTKLGWIFIGDFS